MVRRVEQAGDIESVVRLEANDLRNDEVLAADRRVERGRQATRRRAERPSVQIVRYAAVALLVSLVAFMSVNLVYRLR